MEPRLTSLLLPIRRSRARGGRQAAVVFCRGTRHAHGARKAHSSSPRGWRRFIGEVRARDGIGLGTQASSLRKWGAVVSTD